MANKRKVKKHVKQKQKSFNEKIFIIIYWHLVSGVE